MLNFINSAFFQLLFFVCVVLFLNNLSIRDPITFTYNVIEVAPIFLRDAITRIYLAKHPSDSLLETYIHAWFKKSSTNVMERRKYFGNHVDISICTECLKTSRKLTDFLSIYDTRSFCSEKPRTNQNSPTWLFQKIPLFGRLRR